MEGKAGALSLAASRPQDPGLRHQPTWPAPQPRLPLLWLRKASDEEEMPSVKTGREHPAERPARGGPVCSVGMRSYYSRSVMWVGNLMLVGHQRPGHPGCQGST